MRAIWRLAAFLAVGALLTAMGCGSSTSPNDASAAAGHAPLALADAKAVVEQFLLYFKKGDDAGAEKLLTRKAVEETKKFELVINVPGDEHAVFEVLEAEAVEFEGGRGAHVLIRWTDGTDKRTEECIMVLRPDEGAWRIAGMIYRPFEDLSPVVFDFEDPKHMLEQMSLVEAEMQRRANAEGAAEARAEDDPFGSRPEGATERTASRPERPSQGNPPNPQ